MGRLLFFLLLALIVYALIRGAIRSRRREPPRQPRDSGAEDMVACARCGVNLPRSEARMEGDRLVCAANPNCR